MEKYRERIIDFSRSLIRFNSTEAQPEEGYPFGRGCGECLEYFLDHAASLGFKVHNYDNYIGEVVFGNGPDFAILAHLDVVPAGDGWRYDPFGAEMNDDISAGGTEGMKIWGRGTLDDKTPAAIILYAMLALRENGIVPNRTIKLILGCNEESGWRCIDHYNEVAVMPDEGFTPDANFPAIYAEKGILHLEFDFDIKGAPIISLSAGDAINMVPASAVAELAVKPAISVNAMSHSAASLTVSGNTLTAIGKSAHASTPDEGSNALEALITALSGIIPDVADVRELLFEKRGGIGDFEDETGRLTFSPDIAKYREGILTVSVDVRYPATYKLEKITEVLDSTGAVYRVMRHSLPIYNDPRGKLITTLSEVYGEATGEHTEPIAIGGGTYARALKSGCAFGPELPGFEAPIHQPNEFITISHIELLADIYYRALEKLFGI